MLFEAVDSPFVALAPEKKMERVALEILVVESGFEEKAGLFWAPKTVVVQAVREMATKVISEIGLLLPLQENLD